MSQESLLLVSAPTAACAAATTGRSSVRPRPRSASCRPRRHPSHLELSGKRAIKYFAFRASPRQKTYTHFEDKPELRGGRALANRYLADYIAGKMDRVEVAYMKFLNAARQAPVVETFLPLLGGAGPRRAEAGRRGRVEYEFLPSAADILQDSLPMSFKVRLFKASWTPR